MVSVRNWGLAAIAIACFGVYGYFKPGTTDPLGSAIVCAAPVAALSSFLLVGADSMSRYIDRKFRELGNLATNHAAHMIEREITSPILKTVTMLSVMHSRRISDANLDTIVDAKSKTEHILNTLSPLDKEEE